MLIISAEEEHKGHKASVSLNKVAQYPITAEKELETRHISSFYTSEHDLTWHLPPHQKDKIPHKMVDNTIKFISASACSFTLISVLSTKFMNHTHSDAHSTSRFG